MSDYYSILGVSFYASSDEIKAKYKRLAVKYHPDKNPDNPEAEEQFKQINAAYQVLSNPQKKSQYDQLILYILTKKAEEEVVETKQTHPRDRRRRPATPYNGPVRKVITPLDRKNVRIVYFLSFLSFVGLVLFCGWFYFFMERFTAETWTEKARVAYNKGEYLRALSFLRDAFKKIGDIPETNHLKGAIEMYEFKNYKSGYYFINRSILFAKQQETPIPTEYYFDRAYALYNLEKYDSASLDLSKVLQDSSGHHHAQILLGDIYLHEKKLYKQAIELYKAAFASDTFKHLATIGEAIAQYELKEYRKSESLLQLAYLQKPESGLVSYYRALNALKAEKDTIKGCILLEQAYTQGVRDARFQQSVYCRSDSTWYYQLYPLLE